MVFVPFANGRPAGAQEDVLTGFLDDRATRAVARWAWRSTKDGAVLVADDVGNAIWRVTPAR